MKKIATALCIRLTVGSCWGGPLTVDMPALEQLFGELQVAIEASDWTAAEQLAVGYAEAEDFNAHVGGAMTEMLVPHEQLLPTAKRVVERCVVMNSLGNLSMLGEMNATEHKERMDFARFHSMRALIELKMGGVASADSSMARAFAYMTGGLEPQAVDLLRAGLIAHAQGRQEEAWEQVLRGLLLDSTVEHTDPAYLSGITELVVTREGRAVEVDAYLTDVRRRHAQPVPDLQLVSADGARSGLQARRGKALFINFYSPACSTCRQEVPAVRPLYDAHADNETVEFLFILNNSNLAEQSDRFLAEVGLSHAPFLTLEGNTAFDYIPGEPTVWIVDPQGRLIARHTGYNAGDESVYEQELLGVMADTLRGRE